MEIHTHAHMLAPSPAGLLRIWPQTSAKHLGHCKRCMHSPQSCPPCSVAERPPPKVKSLQDRDFRNTPSVLEKPLQSSGAKLRAQRGPELSLAGFLISTSLSPPCREGQQAGFVPLSSPCRVGLMTDPPKQTVRPPAGLMSDYFSSRLEQKRIDCLQGWAFFLTLRNGV